MRAKLDAYIPHIKNIMATAESSHDYRDDEGYRAMIDEISLLEHEMSENLARANEDPAILKEAAALHNQKL